MRKRMFVAICTAIAMLAIVRSGLAADAAGDSVGTGQPTAVKHATKVSAAKPKSHKKPGATIGGKDIGKEHIEFDPTDDDQNDPGHLQLGNPSVAPGATSNDSKP